jgi:uncharacterized protein with NRDE domain
MCLILIACQVHPLYPLVVAANRDEYFARPSLPAGFWPDAPQLLAGRDLSAGGTWLGINRNGRFAALTNIREPDVAEPQGVISRGHLVSEFLTAEQSAVSYLRHLRPERYNGFNLICGHVSRLYYASNRNGPPQPLGAGIHGVSNALLNTPWPKLEGGRQALQQCLTQNDTLSPDQLLPILNHRQRPSDHQLPATGVSLELERILSSRFIEGQAMGYGTRASTVLLVSKDGEIQFTEWSWDSNGDPGGREDVQLTLDPWEPY